MKAHTCLLSFAKKPFMWLAWASFVGRVWDDTHARMRHAYDSVLQAAAALADLGHVAAAM